MLYNISKNNFSGDSDNDAWKNNMHSTRIGKIFQNKIFCKIVSVTMSFKRQTTYSSCKLYL